MKSCAGVVRTNFAGLGGVRSQKHSAAAVSTHVIWGAAEELSCERLARLHGLIGKVGAH